MGGKLDLSAGKQDFAAIILVAGKGVRMKSSLPKVLHKIAGKPMILRTLDIIDQVRPRQTIIVTSSQSDYLIKKIKTVIDFPD